MNSNILMAIVGLLVAAVAVKSVTTTKENWFQPRSVKVQRVVHEVPYHQFVASRNLQSVISPRMNSASYGAHIRMRLPEKGNLAVPENPLTHNNTISTGVVKEGYHAHSNECRKTPFNDSRALGSPAPGYVTGDYDEVEAKAIDAGQQHVIQHGLMSLEAPRLNEHGEMVQPIVYDRYMFANKKSRIQEHTCPIRGPLAIKPLEKGWFSVSANPSELPTGAMSVLGGHQNQQGQNIAGLVHEHSGRTKHTLGGIEHPSHALNVSMGTQFDLGGQPFHGQTLMATAFP